MSQVIRIKVSSREPEWITTVSTKKNCLIFASKPDFDEILIKPLKEHPNQENKAKIRFLIDNAEKAELKGHYGYPSPTLLKKMGINYKNLFILRAKERDYYRLYAFDSFKRSFFGDIDRWKTGRPGMLTLDIGEIKKYIHRFV